MTAYTCTFTPYGRDPTQFTIEATTGRDALAIMQRRYGGTRDQWSVEAVPLGGAITYATMRRALARDPKEREFWHRLIGSIRKAATL